MGIFREEIQLGGKAISVETGKLANQADGSVVVECGNTVVLVTVVSKGEPRPGSFLPLTVDVEERMYAAGKIPGGFIKREGRPSERSILTARLIDRPIRPSFPESFTEEIQIIALILSADQVNPPDVLALTGASCALTISDIPFERPIAAVRIGWARGKWIIDPTYDELAQSDMDLVVAGNQHAILMVEAGAKQVKEERFVEALDKAHAAIVELIKFQEQFQAKAGKPKREVVRSEESLQVEAKVRKEALVKIKEATTVIDKRERKDKLNEINEELAEKFTPAFEEEEHLELYIEDAVAKLEKETVRQRLVKEGKRLDGRGPDEIRSLHSEVGVLARTHGSGLFGRGQTQVLTVATLGAMSEEQKIDDLSVAESKRFIHHYNFPPFSVGETAFMRGPKRRELGHGALAEKALSVLIPSETEFPYTIRLVSEVLESNGSTSMASVCASSLALMDAGVPIKGAVAGIAMGLVKEKEKSVILTDILGDEDALGDMDFKVAGTRQGITALQMDIKAKQGLDKKTLEEALTRAREARELILDKMDEAIEKPREKVSEFAPRVIAIKISPDKIREVIGPGGKTIHSIIDETGVTIDIEDDGTVLITSEDETSGEKAREIVNMITREVKVGDKYLGTVTKTTPFGAFVEILPGREGLVHISKLAKGHVNKVEDVVKSGEKISVEVIGIDAQNRISLAKVSM